MPAHFRSDYYADTKPMEETVRKALGNQLKNVDVPVRAASLSDHLVARHTNQQCIPT